MGGEPAQPTSFAPKQDMIDYVLSQLDTVLSPMPSQPPIVNMIVALGNLSSLLFYAYNALVSPNAELQRLPVNWVGFYLVTSETAMSLGPFQGRVACTKIQIGRGVCGTAALHRKTQVVANVHEFPGHIACDGDSNSEIVVPIVANIPFTGAHEALMPPRRVVGVLDIDSTSLSQFSADLDAPFLERVAEVLAERIQFPLCPSPKSGPFGSADTPREVPPEASSTPSTTRVTLAPPLADDAPLSPPPAVTPTVFKTRSGWEFQSTSLPRIASQEEQRQLEAALGVKAIPEIIFPANALRIVSPRGGVVLHIDTFHVLQSATWLYQQRKAAQGTALEGLGSALRFGGGSDALQVPASPSWAASRERYHVFDPLVDWAWRHRYFGFPQQQHAPPLLQSLRVEEDDNALIDWALLRRQDIPIQHFGKLCIFEDDLHDNGLVLQLVKYRVMEPCFFVLLRHVVHVHGSGTCVRDVRIFYKFNAGATAEEEEASIAAGDHGLVFEEQWRHATASQIGEGNHGGLDTTWNEDNADRLVEALPIVETKRYRLRRD